MDTNEMDNWADNWSSSESDETGSSYSEESNSSLRMEAVRVGGERLLLPQGLCENPDVFREFLSLDTWYSFSESQRQHLKNFLPTFPESDAEEKDETIRMLLGRENIKFGNPLTEFHKHLRAAHYRPDVSKMRALLRKAQYKDYKRAERWRVYELLKSVLSSRQRLVESVVNGEKPKVCPSPPKRPRTVLAQNVKNRYFQELALIREEVGESSQSSEDENYPEGPSSLLNKKQLQQRRQTVVGLLETSLNSGGGNNDGSGSNNCFGGNETVMQPVLGTLCPGPNPWDPASRLPNSNPYIAQEQPYMQMLAAHAKRRANREEHPDLKVDGITLHDIAQRCKIFKKQSSSKTVVAKRSKVKACRAAPISSVMMEEDGEETSDIEDNGGVLGTVTSTSVLQRDVEEEGIDVEGVDDLPSLPVVIRTINPIRASSPKASKSSTTSGKRLTKGEPPPHIAVDHGLMTIVKKTNEMASGPDSLTRRLSLESDRSVGSNRTSGNRPRLVDSVQQTEHQVISPRKVQSRSVSETSSTSQQQSGEPSVVTLRKIAATSTLDPSWITCHTSQISKSKEVGKENWIIKGDKFTKIVPEDSPPQITVRTSTPAVVVNSGRQTISTSSTGTNTSNQQQYTVVTPVKTVTSLNTTRPLMTPATLSDLDGIDMMDLPVDFDVSSPLSLDDIKPAHPELMQETHACFFSLIRDILTSTPDHRIEMKELESRVKAWAASPIGPINQWYTPKLETRLTSAIQFLAGDLPECVPDDYVPYMEWKANVGAYQWIGAGRDSDHRLVALCDIWLNPSLAKQQPREITVKPPTSTAISGSHKGSGNRVNSSGQIGPTTSSRSHHGRSDSNQRPPPLKPSSPKDREIFRMQEKQRFDTPYRAFTYCIAGVESTVGPVRSVQNSNQANASNQPSKARGHLLLVDSRPKYVTILELVRDAVARLPNAQGTRADIVTLLKDSQYLATDAAESVISSVVSGALDKLHCEHDPCVRFDTQRKLWIYLHKGRTAEEFERLHALGEDMRVIAPKPRKKRPNKPKKDTVQNVEFSSAENAMIVTDSGQTLQSSAQETSATGVCVMSAGNVGSPLLLQANKPKVQTQVRTNATATATVATAAKKALATTTEVGGAKSLLSSGTKTVSPQLLSRLQQQAALVKRQQLAVVTGGEAGQKSVSTSTVTAAASLLPPRTIVHDIVATSRPQQQNIVKKVTQQQAVSIATEALAKQGGKSIVKVLTSQAATNTSRGVQRVPQGSQTTQQQVIHLKQQTLTGEPKLLQKATAAIGGVMKKATSSSTGQSHQQVIVMKQAVAGDQASGSTGQQMIVINQQPVVVDSQQLTAKQQKQLQQFLNKQHLEQQQQQQTTNAVATAAIQQQQLQQLLLAKQQQQIVNDQQQKTVVKVQQPQQQQMIVVKQQGGNVTTSDGQIVKQQPGTVQQMILVKQTSSSSANVGGEGDGASGTNSTIAATTTTATQITQQQLQQMLLLKQQQQQQQQQIIMVKQQDQKSVQVIAQQVPKSQAQQVTLAQLQQLQQQQQQRNAATTSLLTHPRVVAHVSSGTMSTVAGTSLIKPQNQTVGVSGGSTSGCSGGSNNGVGGIGGVGTSVVAKVVTSTQPSVLTMESLLAHHKQQSVTQQVSRAGLTSQYAVVSLPQTRVVQTSLPQVVASTSNASGNVVAVSTVSGETGVSKITTAQGVRIPGLNLAQLGGKQLLLAASKPQATATLQGQNVLLGQAASGGTLLVGSGQQGTVTVLQQGSQQILIQPGTLKTLQGLKVIPLTQAKPQTLQAGRQQVFARIINPSSVRPVLAANIIQQPQQDSTPIVTTSAQSTGQTAPASATTVVLKCINSATRSLT
ncbi:uncharacterized protein isoform X3 [Rhodnius prolixus]|uniref:uncharacterized protein isoform X3 n=1 Tax=Rhodnius prolixus TaxID=13249 RepID=UPI003D18862B